MVAIASQITSLRIVYSTVIQTQIKENIKAPRHWPLCGEFTGHRWIPRTNGQLREKCHLKIPFDDVIMEKWSVLKSNVDKHVHSCISGCLLIIYPCFGWPLCHPTSFMPICYFYVLYSTGCQESSACYERLARTRRYFLFVLCCGFNFSWFSSFWLAGRTRPNSGCKRLVQKCRYCTTAKLCGLLPS